MQAQDALEAVEADMPAYPIEPIRSKRLKEADKGPERIMKVSSQPAFSTRAVRCIACCRSNVSSVPWS